MSLLKCFLQTFRQCCLNISCAPFFMLALVFYALYYCWPYSAQLPDHLATAIVDEDNTSLSCGLVQALRSVPALDVILVTNNREIGINAMREEKVVALAGIPADFERDAIAGIPTALTLVADGAFIVKSRTAISGATGPLKETAEAALAAQMERYGFPIDKLAASALKAPSMVLQPMYNNISGYLNFAVPIVFIIIIQTLMTCGTGMLFNDWFSENTKPEILTAALSSPSRLLAVQAPVFLITFLWTVIVEGDIFALHGINSFQNISATLLMSAFFALAVSSFAIFAGIALGPGRYVIQAVVLTSIPCIFISGNLWPWQNIPVYMQALAWLFPSTPGASGMLRVSQSGASIGESLPFLGHLLILSIFYMAAAVFLAKRRKNR